jgi:hypothetical protein
VRATKGEHPTVVMGHVEAQAVPLGVLLWPVRFRAAEPRYRVEWVTTTTIRDGGGTRTWVTWHMEDGSTRDFRVGEMVVVDEEALA